MQIAMIQSAGYRPITIGRVQAMTPANDSATIIRSSVDSLRATERMLLSELAMGDVNVAEIMAELTMVRRSIVAAGGKGVLKFA